MWTDTLPPLKPVVSHVPLMHLQIRADILWISWDILLAVAIGLLSMLYSILGISWDILQIRTDILAI
jgi:hypothetical protein